MVDIVQENDHIRFVIKGWHKVWALKGSLAVQKQNITAVYASDNKIDYYTGLRMPGTYVPFLIRAGTYITNGEKYFWDVTRYSKTIVVVLKNERYKELHVGVKDVEEAIRMLK